MNQWANRTHKTCKRCGDEKPLSDFYRFKTGKYAPRCKPCYNIVQWERKKAAGIEKVKAYKRKRYAEVEREQVLAKSRARYDADPEAMKAHWREQYRRQYAANPERFIDKVNRRRAMTHGALAVPVKFQEILLRDEGYCGICDKPIMETAIELDHILPLAAGGTHEPNNVQLAHRSCNRRKHANPEYRAA